ncbi:MAG: hypothetical protein HRT47_09820 [Candidatus Caenarcaniphilales bacterium]|nr:hypothetical protein [Candidatus Caenarcaniphilales bacterium]
MNKINPQISQPLVSQLVSSSSSNDNFAKSEDGELFLLREVVDGEYKWTILDKDGEKQLGFDDSIFSRETRDRDTGTTNSSLNLNSDLVSKIDDAQLKRIIETYENIGFKEITGSQWGELKAPGTASERADAFFSSSDSEETDTNSPWEQNSNIVPENGGMDNGPVSADVSVSQLPGFDKGLKIFTKGSIERLGERSEPDPLANNEQFKSVLVDNLKGNISLVFQDYFSTMGDQEFTDLVNNGPDKELLKELPSNDRKYIKRLFTDYQRILKEDPSKIDQLKTIMSQNLSVMFQELDFTSIDNQNGREMNTTRNLYLGSFGIDSLKLEESGQKVFDRVLEETKAGFTYTQ